MGALLNDMVCDQGNKNHINRLLVSSFTTWKFPLQPNKQEAKQNKKSTTLLRLQERGGQTVALEIGETDRQTQGAAAPQSRDSQVETATRTSAG